MRLEVRDASSGEARKQFSYLMKEARRGLRGLRKRRWGIRMHPVMKIEIALR